MLTTSPDAFSAPEFYGFSSQAGANISQVEWRILGDTISGGFFGVDNVSFGTLTAVPESSTAALFGVGLAGIFISINRKRKGPDGGSV